ncbi:MAG: type II toxin-antitoxin system RelE family toxin [Janthinobacterium lividum]
MSEAHWQIIFDPKAEKEFFKLDVSIQRQIQQFLRKNIVPSSNPRQFGKALKGDLASFWRYRVGDYRLLCTFEDNNCLIFVIQIGHRREIYH